MSDGLFPVPGGPLLLGWLAGIGGGAIFFGTGGGGDDTDAAGGLVTIGAGAAGGALVGGVNTDRRPTGLLALPSGSGWKTAGRPIGFAAEPSAGEVKLLIDGRAGGFGESGARSDAVDTMGAAEETAGRFRRGSFVRSITAGLGVVG